MIILGWSVLLFSLDVVFTVQVHGQDSLLVTDTYVMQKDISDVIRHAMNKPPKVKPESAWSLLLLPIIGSNPATGFMIGIGGQYAFKVPGSSLYSAFMGSVQLTTKSQVLFLLKNNIYTKDNRFFLRRDWRFQIFSRETYGLGTNSPEGGIINYQYNLLGLETSIDSMALPMKFNFVLSEFKPDQNSLKLYNLS